jgi:hypothetical protein
MRRKHKPGGTTPPGLMPAAPVTAVRCPQASPGRLGATLRTGSVLLLL